MTIGENKMPGYNSTYCKDPRGMYHELGLCYDCGKRFKSCKCEKPEWLEYANAEGQRVIEECEEDDPRTEEEMLLDEWQATVDDVRSLLLGC